MYVHVDVQVYRCMVRELSF